MEKSVHDSSNEAMKRKKDSFTLDFSSGSKKARAQQDLHEGILSSPDVRLLTLATPELDRFIIHQGGTMVPTPTQILFPKSVTEEQEAYARGFVDALVELHMKQSPLATSGGFVCLDGGQGPSYVALTSLAGPQLQANLEAINTLKCNQLLASPIFSRPSTLDFSAQLRLLPAVPPFLLSSPIATLPSPIIPLPIAQSLTPQQELPMELTGKSKMPSSSRSAAKDSSETVSNVTSSPPLSPIDMSNQDRVKLERKREKNRNAAQKCRTKKLERISRLEARVNELKKQNASLAVISNSHKDHVNRLRQQIVDHVNTGCQIMIVSESS